MIEFGKDKIAIFLVYTSVLGGETQLNISKAQSPQTVAAVKGAASIAQRKSFKPLAIVASTLAITTAAGAAICGLTCKKDEKLDTKAKIMPTTTSMVKEVNNNKSKKEDIMNSKIDANKEIVIQSKKNNLMPTTTSMVKEVNNNKSKKEDIMNSKIDANKEIVIQSKKNNLMPITTSMVTEVNNDESKKEDIRAINRAQENNQSVPEDLNKLSNNENIILNQISDSKFFDKETKNAFLKVFKYFVKRVKLRDIEEACYISPSNHDRAKEFLVQLNEIFSDLDKIAEIKRYVGESFSSPVLKLKIWCNKYNKTITITLEKADETTFICCSTEDFNEFFLSIE